MIEAVGLRAAAQLLRTGQGKAPTPQTMRNWASVGYRPRGWDGAPVVLKTVRLGIDLVTTPEWVAEFDKARWEMGEQIRRAELERKAAPHSMPMRTRRASQKRAAQYLDQAGCK